LASRPAAGCIDVWKTYTTASGQVTALSGVDARFEAGAVTALVGPSGSGKSTLLQLLATLDRPTHGEVVLQGWELAELGHRRLRRLRRDLVTYVFQRPADNFVPHLTLAEHASLADAAGPQRALDLFEQFGIDHRVDHRPQALSGGEQARAAFALALLRRTPLIMADEPTAELDDESAAALLDAVRAHAGEGVAFVLATHDPNVIGVADAVVRLERGRIATAGERFDGARAVDPPSRAGRKGDAVAIARGVRKDFRQGAETTHAVRDASIELHPGELIALVGRSGSGKSTLLNVLAGWQRPDAGEVAYTVDGAQRDPATLSWADLAVLPQKFGLMHELTVRENVEYPARLARHLERQRPWIDSLIADLDLAGLEDRLPEEISIGQQQRAALARGLALEPAVLLADEPTAHQDEQSRTAILDLLRRAASAGTCCVVASHEDIGTHADATWTMADGRLADAPEAGQPGRRSPIQ
jgi:putative ABC transport system ATP-binding protein